MAIATPTRYRTSAPLGVGRHLGFRRAGRRAQAGGRHSRDDRGRAAAAGRVGRFPRRRRRLPQRQALLRRCVPTSSLRREQRSARPACDGGIADGAIGGLRQRRGGRGLRATLAEGARRKWARSVGGEGIAAAPFASRPTAERRRDGVRLGVARMLAAGRLEIQDRGEARPPPDGGADRALRRRRLCRRRGAPHALCR